MTEIKNNIFNIKSNQHFLNSLLLWLENSAIKNLSEVTILFPSQRSVREFNQIFLQQKLKNNQNHQNSIILPKIKAISDISYEDFFDFLPNNQINEIIDEILQINLISDFEFLFLISQEVKKSPVFGNKIESSQAVNIAIRLKNLFDEVEKYQVDLTKLQEIDDSDMSLHRQISLEFLQNFYVKIKNLLIKENRYFSSALHNFVIDKFCYAIEKFGLKNPVIIAGSSGSLPAGKKLIKTISNQNNGFVFIYGFDENAVVEQEIHPQFILNELIDFLKINKNQITQINYKNNILSEKSRLDFLNLLSMESSETIKWQNISEPDSTIKSDIENNFLLITAKNEINEAELISIILTEARFEGKKCAIISNNDKLAELIKLNLKNLKLNFNDSRNIGITNSLLINFIINILELVSDDFSSYNLISILKNPLCLNYQYQIIYDFEKQVLRQDRINADFEGIKAKLSELKNDKLSEFFDQFYQKITPLKTCNSELELSDYVTILISVIEKITNQTWENLLKQEPAQLEIFNFFENIQSKQNFIIHKTDFIYLFKTLIQQVSFFEKSDSSSEIQILSTIEARLLNFDLIIITSLNEGNFPKIESENWLGKKIRKDLEIDKKLRKIGQNSYDFCNYLSNKKVVLTRSLNSQDSVEIISPFLLKFITLCQKLNIKVNYGEKYFEILELKKAVINNKIKQPQPKPKLKYRNKNLAITDIQKLISDPYSIFVKRILKLKKLQEIDFEPSYAEFGSFIHKALEEFVKNPCNNFPIIANKIFKNYFLSQKAELIWFPKFQSIFDNFIKDEKQLEVVKSYCELVAKLTIKDVTISGKTDRLTYEKNNLVNIFDYKTGQIPSKKSVFNGLEPQLTIYALMLIEGVLEQEIKNISINQINSINYWKVSTNSDAEITKICNNNEQLKMLISAAKLGLHQLIDYFSNENNSYIAAPNPEIYKENEYSHLARVKEWM